MNRVPAIVASLIVAFAGCKQPTEIELKPADPGNDAVVAVVQPIDSTAPSLPADSIAILPADASEYAGMILLSSVTYSDTNGIRYGAFSWVYFADRDRPFRILPATPVLGYYGIPLLSLALDGNTMVRDPHYVRGVLSGREFKWGWEYSLDLTPGYQPNHTYHWQSAADSIGSVDAQIASPDNLVVQSPAGGSKVSRTSDLTLRWVGSGDLTIIISKLTEGGRTQPVLTVKPSRNIGHLVLKASLLQLLAKDKPVWFTFVLANRDASISVGGYNSSVLVQAASVYNTYVELR